MNTVRSSARERSVGVWALDRLNASPRHRAAFTLMELLVVIGVVALLSAMTAIAYRGVAKDARLASGKNAVMAVLDNARALAMRNNEIVMAVFRARQIGEGEQQIEASFAQWTGQSYVVPGITGVVDRFRLIPNTPVRLLPRGVQVAGPMYGGNLDYVWQSCTYFPGVAVGEAPGAVIGVMFMPNGTVATRNNVNDSARVFVDFNNDGLQRQNGNDFDNINAFPDNIGSCYMGPDGYTGELRQFFCHSHSDDEPYVSNAAYLAVFDDEAARESFNAAQWNDPVTRREELSQFINENAARIHFNRYTGVAMK